MSDQEEFVGAMDDAEVESEDEDEIIEEEGDEQDDDEDADGQEPTGRQRYLESMSARLVPALRALLGTKLLAFLHSFVWWIKERRTTVKKMKLARFVCIFREITWIQMTSLFAILQLTSPRTRYPPASQLHPFGVHVCPHKLTSSLVVLSCSSDWTGHA
jgi:hypothetical protein